MQNNTCFLTHLHEKNPTELNSIKFYAGVDTKKSAKNLKVECEETAVRVKRKKADKTSLSEDSRNAPL